MIIGALGQLGYDCTRVLGQKNEIIPIDLGQVDITDLKALEGVISSISPDIVLNCAAYTKVDASETDRERAWKVNAEGPGNIALCISRYGGKLVHVSTDYVFDGRKLPPDSYAEDDETNPLSYYGKTKLEGEVIIRKTTDRHIIVRTAWLYGINGQNFLKTMLRLSLSSPGKEIRVVNDQYGSPTWSYRLAQQVDNLIGKNCQGTYHATSEGYCTWYELARYFLERVGIEYNIVPCSTEEYPTPATRPGNSILENKRLKEEGINLMPCWQNEVDEFVKNFKIPLIEECYASMQ